MQGCKPAQRGADLGRSQLPAQSGGLQQHAAEDAAPWESIVQEGFQATLAGSENGKVFGAGINFARDSSLAHKYAVNSARRSQSGKNEQETLRVFLSRIVTGVYTGVPSTLNPKRVVLHFPWRLQGIHLATVCDALPHTRNVFVRGDAALHTDAWFMCMAQTERLA